MIVFLFGSGFRRFSSGMPVISSNSLAISAACHSSRDKNTDETLQPLKYGVISGTSDGAQATGFSASEVQPLRDGGVYAGTPNLSYKTTQMCLEHIAFWKLSHKEQFHILTTNLALRSHQGIRTEDYPKLYRRSQNRLSMYTAANTSPGHWRLPVHTQLAIFATNLRSATNTEDENSVGRGRMPHLDAYDAHIFLRHLDRNRERITRKSDSSTKLWLDIVEASIRAPHRRPTESQQPCASDLLSSGLKDMPFYDLFNEDQNKLLSLHWLT